MTQISVLSRTESREPPFQGWRTPDRIYQQLNTEERMGYGIDLFADKDNAKCGQFFTEEDSAFDNDWGVRGSGGTGFGNPPYNGKNQARAVYEAIRQVRELGNLTHVDLLVQASTGTKWFYRALNECEVQLFRGRISFDVPSDRINLRRPSFANALIRIHNGSQRGLTGIRDNVTGALIRVFP